MFGYEAPYDPSTTVRLDCVKGGRESLKVHENYKTHFL